MKISGRTLRKKDFKDLSALKAFFPTVPVMALTATAPSQMLKKLKHSLSLKTDCKVIAANPNRSNIYLEKKVRMSNHHGYEGFDQILVPIANDLALQRERYPMTIIYLKLKYCGYAYGLFERILADKQFVGETKISIWKAICPISCSPNKTYEEEYNFRNKRRELENTGFACHISSWYGCKCSLCGTHYTHLPTHFLREKPWGRGCRECTKLHPPQSH